MGARENESTGRKTGSPVMACRVASLALSRSKDAAVPVEEHVAFLACVSQDVYLADGPHARIIVHGPRALLRVVHVRHIVPWSGGGREVELGIRSGIM